MLLSNLIRNIEHLGLFLNLNCIKKYVFISNELTALPTLKFMLKLSNLKVFSQNSSAF